jgi:ATP-dependent RNA helicase RhlE
VYGGVEAGAQDRALRSGVDVVIATPGRLLDHMNSGAADFSGVQALVLDEADRMLDMGFWPSVRRIVAATPTNRQTLLFSATMADEVLWSAAQIMRQPRMIQLASTGLATTLRHVGHQVPSAAKLSWLSTFLRRSSGRSLIFVRTKHGADRLARRLSAAGIRCAALHADRSQAQRTSAVERFRTGEYPTLVATDIAARGLDIDGIDHVVNYEVPANAETYVHRAGRTGRAELTGTAMTLFAPEELPAIRAIERALNLDLAPPADDPSGSGSTARN